MMGLPALTKGRSCRQNLSDTENKSQRHIRAFVKNNSVQKFWSQGREARETCNRLQQRLLDPLILVERVG